MSVTQPNALVQANQEYLGSLSAISDLLNHSLLLMQELLHMFSSNPEFTDRMVLVFGNNFNREDLRTSWQAHELPLFPSLQIRSSAELNGALGAFSADTDTIYLSYEFLNQNFPEKIASVLLEEYGHRLDNVINTVDTPGDEGELFSKIVSGQLLSEIDSQRIEAENDWSSISIDGNILTVEQAIEANPSIPIVDDGKDNILSTKYQSFGGPLFHEGVNFLDVVQGNLGNCYLMAALAEIAQHLTSEISRIITQTTNGFRVTVSGTTVDIDNNLPIYTSPNYSGNPVFASYKFSKNGVSYEEGWVALIEKAYAIVNGKKDLLGPKSYSPGINSYSTIVSGGAAGAVKDLMGRGTAGYEEISSMTDQRLHSLLVIAQLNSQSV